MKKIISIPAAVLLIVFACNNTAQTTVSSNLESDFQKHDSTKLNGAWQLNYIDGKNDSFAIFFPGKNPFISFSLTDKTLNGNTGCNKFKGNLVTESNKISFAEPMIMTKMACPGNGELVFLHHLNRVKTYSLPNDTTLIFKSGDTVIMKFKKSILR